MAAPMTDFSPLPAFGFTETIPTATVVVLDPQPVSNTKDVVVYNLDTTAFVTVAFINVQGRQAGGIVTFNWQTTGAQTQIPQPGDTVTVGGVACTAVGSATPGLNQFSVPVQASAPVITVNSYPLTGSHQIIFQKSVGDVKFTLPTLVGTAGGAGVNEFNTTAGSANAVAASIAAAVNALANAYAPEYVWAVAVGATVEFFAGNNLLGEEGDGIVATVFSSGAQISPSEVETTGGVDGQYNNDFVMSFAQAINSGTNGWTAISDAWVAGTTSPSRLVVLSAVPAGAAGNAVTLATASGGRITISGANFTGGVDGVPASLAYGTVIPPESAFTFNIGPEGNRQPLGTEAFWTANPGSGLAIAVEHDGGGDVDVNVTYVQNRGFTGEPST